MLSVLKPLTLTPWRKTKRASCPATKNNLPYNEIIGYHIDRRVSTLLNKLLNKFLYQSVLLNWMETSIKKALGECQSLNSTGSTLLNKFCYQRV